MSVRYLPIACAVLLAMTARPCFAQPDGVVIDQRTPLAERAEDIVAVLGGTMQADEAFSGSFLADVSAEQLAAMNTQLTAQFGALLTLESLVPDGSARARVTYRFERALGSGALEIEPAAPYRITGLRLTSFVPLNDDAASIDRDLAALPGDISVYFGPLEAGEPLYARDADGSYPIGSTFKLYVLSALTRSIAGGEHAWADIVPLSVRSMPSGTLQDWPMGSPLTLQTLATMMIAGSDNTATDQLIAVLGREAVEAELRASGHGDADAALPLLTTFEMFALKSDISRGEKYASSAASERREQLTRLADVDYDDITAWTDARLIDSVEWFATMGDLRGILKRIVGSGESTALDIMAVNRSMPSEIARDWDFIGYKGGSEPGVLNFTWLLRGKDDRWHMLGMSWKDETNALAVPQFELFAQRIMALAR